jgi:sigma-B regulation protein RsbU (phosphoserine phosphatase)
VQKPWDNLRLLGTIEKQAREAAARRNAQRLARSEIEIARHVQEKLFPQPVKQLRTIRYAARCVPARDVSGDYYDFLDLAPGALGFVLADVSGKGMAAALLMASLQAAFRSQTEVVRDGCELLRGINRLFYSSTPLEQYATVFFADYDDHSRTLRYVNCGHPAPLLVRANGVVERLHSTAPVVGLLNVWDCEEAVLHIGPGDTLVAFSDGVTEAGIDGGEEFGEERLLAAIAEAGDGDPESLIQKINEKVCTHARSGAGDDCTVLVIRGV